MAVEASATISFMRPEPIPPREDEAAFRPQPNSVEETGIGFGQILDLCTKTIYYGGRPSAREISEQMTLPFNIVETALNFLKREKFIEVVGSVGIGEQQYQYALTEKGAEKAAETLERNQYIGPTPVPFEEYVEVVKQQSVRQGRVDAAAVDEALTDLVLTRTTRSLVGPAVNSGRSLLLYGDPGNGKSSIAKGIGRMLTGSILIPHAVDVGGQTIRVYDPRVHRELMIPVDEARRDGNAIPARAERRRDMRWAIAQRPLILTGGELTLADLELKFSPQSKFYIAPLQMKANCGLPVVDDFGRQLVQPKELLNRWIIPMEARVDYLSLLSGETVEVPFELLLVFSTNTPPQGLGDEAFSRRTRHKIEVGDPDEASFLQILRMVCERNSIHYSEVGGRYLIDRYSKPASRHFRGVHPRDIIDLLLDISSFQGRTPEFTPDWIDLACASYFIDERKEEPAVL